MLAINRQMWIKSEYHEELNQIFDVERPVFVENVYDIEDEHGGIAYVSQRTPSGGRGSTGVLFYKLEPLHKENK